MNDSQRDWEVGEKVIADLRQCRKSFDWIEEPSVSPDRPLHLR